MLAPMGFGTFGCDGALSIPTNPRLGTARRSTKITDPTGRPRPSTSWYTWSHVLSAPSRKGEVTRPHGSAVSAAASCDLGLPRTKTTAVELPPPDTKRWTARRKAVVFEAVHSGMITIEEVCRRYALSVEEFLSGHNTTQMHGVEGLEITKLQNYRYPARKGAERAQYVVTDEVNEVGGSSESNRCRAGSIRCLWDTQSRA
jgi:hypothetical protein